MRKHITSFDTHKHHIHLECFLTDAHGILYSVAGILDTGAPQTEFSDQFLVYAGLLESRREKTIIPILKSFRSIDILQRLSAHTCLSDT